MTISISSPEAAVAATPYLLGFNPQDSLVILFSQSDGFHMTMRVDLPDGPDIDWLQTLLDGVPDPLPARAVILAYADTVGYDCAAGVADWMALVLLPLMHVADVLLIEGGRVFSRMCGDPQCSDPCGVDVGSLRDHPIVAQCVAAGMSHLPDRASLSTQLEAVHDELAGRVARLLREPVPGDYEAVRDRLEAACLRILGSDEDLTARDIACLARACRDIHVRDPLIRVLLERKDIGTVTLPSVRARLTFAVTRLPQAFVGAVAAVLSVLAWADGDGAAALVASDRAREADPDNSLAPLVAHALQFGLPPDTWSQLTRDIPMDVLRGRRPR